MNVDSTAVNEMTVGLMYVDKMIVYKMTVDTMSVDKMTVDKMTVDKPPRCQINIRECFKHTKVNSLIFLECLKALVEVDIIRITFKKLVFINISIDSLYYNAFINTIS